MTRWPDGDVGDDADDAGYNAAAVMLKGIVKPEKRYESNHL